MRNRLIAVGLGSNLGSPIDNLRQALKLLKREFTVLKVSGIYESEALTLPDAPEEWNKKFLNAVVLAEVNAHLTPSEILISLKKIEKNMGRADSARWAPRIIDLDILFWNESDFESEILSIPHRELYNRPFALLPLLEVWNRREVLRGRSIAWAEEWADKSDFSTMRSKKFVWPAMMGIVNLTADSFSDGGALLTDEKLSEHLLRLQQDGAEIFDFGAESTRPGAVSVSDEIELQRLKNALRLFKDLKIDAKISIDCRKPEVLRLLSDRYKFDYINDVEGLASPMMINFARQGDCKVIVMHSLSVPPRKDLILSSATDPIEQIGRWWSEKISSMQEAGLSKSNLIMDPGIGFGKTPAQNLHILKHAGRLTSLDTDVLFGYSRKSVFELFGSRPAEIRDEETAVVTAALAKLPISILRVHDVAAQRAAWVGGGCFDF